MKQSVFAVTFYWIDIVDQQATAQTQYFDSLNEAEDYRDKLKSDNQAYLDWSQKLCVKIVRYDFNTVIETILC